jgi:succinoglycan biosynthesis protein ExoV
LNVVYPAGSGNVGDELNGILWNSLLPDLKDQETMLLGIGTLLNESFCARLVDAKRILVLGTGAGYGPPPVMDERWHVYAVRGKRSACRLGLPSEKAVADAAYLLATLGWSQPKTKGGVVVIPHHRSLRLLDWEQLCAEAGLIFLSPLAPIPQFIERLCNADLVIAEAMHGAILADIARVPWRAFSFGRQFNQDKWSDWSEMFGLDIELCQVDGYYDPSYYLADRASWKHLSNHLKASFAQYGWGKEKWRRVTPPGNPMPRARADTVRALRRIAGWEGQLSGESIMNERAEQLYERLNKLRYAHGLAIGNVLTGDSHAYFATGVPQ